MSAIRWSYFLVFEFKYAGKVVQSTKCMRRRQKSSHSRLRSRNKVIDSWLVDEDGSDAFADLEDFLVDE